MTRQYTARQRMINDIKHRWHITNPRMIAKIVICFEEVEDQSGTNYIELMGMIEEDAMRNGLTVVEELRQDGTL